MKSIGYLMAILIAPLFGVRGLAAEGDWMVNATVQALAGSYEDSDARDGIYNAGILLHADYLQQAGVSFGYNRTAVNFLAADQDLDQNQFYLSGRFWVTPDWAAGRIGLRLDGHWVDNDDSSNGTGDLEIVAPQLSYSNLDRTFYVDLGYARSTYGEAELFAGELTLDQLTPTLGFGFNEIKDWLQLRGFLIDASNPVRAQGKRDTSAVEAKWTHWFSGSGPLGLEHVTFSVLAGERLFGVDPDSAVVFNIADIQQDSLGLAGQWRLDDRNRVLLQFGYEGYRNELINNEYSSIYIYLSFTRQWD